MSEGKKCRDCGQVKPVGEFWKRKASPDGLALYCKECFGLRNAAKYRRKQAADGKEARPYRRHSAVPAGMKYCPQCEEVKSLDAFGRNRANASGLADYCKPCHNRVMAEGRTRNHGSSRNYLLKLRYGITEAEADALRERQGGICLICLRSPAAHVDHSHLTGLVRGMLCFRCNGALGQFEDDEWRLREAADYLEGRNAHSRWMRVEFGRTKILGESRRHLESQRGDGRAAQLGSSRHYHLRGRYGMTEGEVASLGEMQGGYCAICCDRPGDHVDHCHDTQAVRGVLCVGCNSGMGQLRDDPGALRRAAAYLRGDLVKEVPSGDDGARLSLTFPDVDPAGVPLDGWDRFREQDASYRRALRDMEELVEWVPWREFAFTEDAVAGP
ncbi:endonuclease VII domain-containing protein [Actinomadura hibisca]|uniref:endonuclease VII domain-containing protein n=1 Tax=Actinomadura hibisca TaxID=68565 RepID=UPI000A9007B0|nr:endonuclease VII domain-containing protein [Actinomadura hibisca]